jgi:hypothetical protein
MFSQSVAINLLMVAAAGISIVVCLLVHERVSRKFLFRLFFLVLVGAFWLEMKVAIALGFYSIPPA